MPQLYLLMLVLTLVAASVMVLIAGLVAAIVHRRPTLTAPTKIALHAVMTMVAITFVLVYVTR